MEQTKSKCECDRCNHSFERIKRKHIQKGCNNTTYTTCNKKFRDVRSLEKRQKIATVTVVCDHCDKTFCSGDAYEKHERSISAPLLHDPACNLDTPVCPKTGYEEEEGYKEHIFEH